MKSRCLPGPSVGMREALATLGLLFALTLASPCFAQTAPKGKTQPSGQALALVAPAGPEVLRIDNAALWMRALWVPAGLDFKAEGLKAAKELEAVGLEKFRERVALPLSKAHQARANPASLDPPDRRATSGRHQAAAALALSPAQIAEIRAEAADFEHVIARMEEAMAAPLWMDLPVRSSMLTSGQDHKHARALILMQHLAAVELQSGQVARGLDRLTRIQAHVSHQLEQSAIGELSRSLLLRVVQNQSAMLAAAFRQHPQWAAEHDSRLDALLSTWSAQALRASATDTAELRYVAHESLDLGRPADVPAWLEHQRDSQAGTGLGMSKQVLLERNRNAIKWDGWDVVHRLLRVHAWASNAPLADWRGVTSYATGLSAAYERAFAPADLRKRNPLVLQADYEALGKKRLEAIAKMTRHHTARMALRAQWLMLRDGIAPHQRQAWLEKAAYPLRDAWDDSAFVYSAERKQIMLKVRGQVPAHELFAIGFAD